MRKEEIAKAVRALNRIIRVYQRRLTKELEARAYTPTDNDVEKFENIITDLAMLRTALKKGHDSIKISGTYEHGHYIYVETLRAISEAGLNYDGNDITGELWIYSARDYIEDFDKGIIEVF